MASTKSAAPSSAVALAVALAVGLGTGGLALGVLAPSTPVVAPPEPAPPAPALPGSPDPVLVGAGDIARCGTDTDEATARLLDAIVVGRPDATVYTLGDNAYPDGTTADFADCYGPSWGRHKARTRPVPGNHDFHTAGGGAYFAYFGAAAGPSGRGYYSYSLGAWHVVALNSNARADAGSPQVRWLRQDLAAHPAPCTLAYFHHATFSSGSGHGDDPRMRAAWDVLYEFAADVVLAAHDHHYERFALQDPAGRPDPARGLRAFVVGTGGASLRGPGAIRPTSEARDFATHGVLQLTLHAAGYSWEFTPVAGRTFRDAGSAPCVGPLAPTESSRGPVPAPATP